VPDYNKRLATIPYYIYDEAAGSPSPILEQQGTEASSTNLNAYGVAADRIRSRERHCGKSDFQLWWRLLQNSRVKAVSTFMSKDVLADVVGEIIESNTTEIQAWLQSPTRDNLPLYYVGAPGKVIGRVMKRGALRATDCIHAVMLKKNASGDWSVVTAFAE
jgi:hypothetical protein